MVEKSNSEGDYDQVEFSGLFVPFELPNLQDYRIRQRIGSVEEVFDIIEFEPRAIRRGKKQLSSVKLRLS